MAHGTNYLSQHKSIVILSKKPYLIKWIETQKVSLQSLPEPPPIKAPVWVLIDLGKQPLRGMDEYSVIEALAEKHSESHINMQKWVESQIRDGTLLWEHSAGFHSEGVALRAKDFKRVSKRFSESKETTSASISVAPQKAELNKSAPIEDTVPHFSDRKIIDDY